MICAATYANPVVHGKCQLPEGHEGAHEDEKTYPNWLVLWTKAWATVLQR